MISFEQAYKIVMQSAFNTKTEIIPFELSYGRILAEDVVSDMDLPPFNRSAVDGYACHSVDANRDLEVVETIAAGREPLRNVGPGECSKIMTGAIVPDGCDLVFMVEESQRQPDGKIRFKGTGSKPNMSTRGEDVRKGDTVLNKGTFIKPQDLGVMATVGHTNVKVRMSPATGIISTGDELVEPSELPGISRIRNSNAYQLLAQVKRAGGKGNYYGIAPDNEDVTFKMIQKAISGNDIVILTGGVSMGDFDFVPSVLKKAGVTIMFDRVNVQPGRPTTFGIHPKALVFGLPGNPVSSFVQFEILVRPLLNKMMGFDWKPIEHKLPLGVAFSRKSADRMGWFPVRVNENSEVIPVDYHGSAHITALPYSEGIIALQPGKQLLEKGELVSVRQV